MKRHRLYAEVHILSEENVGKYIGLLLEQTQRSKPEATAEETAVDLAIKAVEVKIHRWEARLLSIEDCAGGIKELRRQREELLRRKTALQKKSRSRKEPSYTDMDQYIRAMQLRLREKKIGYNRETIREILSK